MATDPSRLPASIVRELKDVVAFCRRRYPNRDPKKPIEFTCTLRIDPENGKILTMDAITGWEKIGDEYHPTYGKACNANGDAFGRCCPKPE